ncbi:O-antigen ligase family protein [Pseudomonadota bacterium]
MTGASLNPSATEAASTEAPVNLRDSAVLISLAIAVLFGSYLLLTSTTDPLPGIQWRYDAKRILQFGLLFLLFLAPALNGRIRDEFGDLLSAVPRWLKITLVAVFSWGVLSVLVNTQSLMQGLNSFSEVALLTSLILGVFVIAACRRIAGRPFDQIAIGLIALTGLTVGVQELIGVVAAQNAGVDFNFRISLLHFSWPRFYNQFQSWTVPALIALPILFSRYKLATVLCAVVLGLQWYIMVMGAARGSVVSLVAASAFALVFLPQIRGRLFKWQAIGLLLGLLIYAIVLYSFSADQPGRNPDPTTAAVESSQEPEGNSTTRDSTFSEDNSGFFRQSLGRPMAHTSGRTAMWRSTLEDVRQHSLLGIGPMNYVCTSSKRIGHPHNFPLQLAAEWGVPVALAVCLLILALLWRATRYIRKNRFASPEDNQLAGLLLTGVLAAACHANLSGVMVMPASQTTGLLIGGLLLGLLPDAYREKPAGLISWGFIPGLILVVALFILGIYELQTMKDRAQLLKPGYDMRPRMWQDSKVCSFYTLQNEVKN